MQRANPFKVGDRVKGIDSQISGYVRKILSESYVMIFEENFEMDMDIHVNELVSAQWQGEAIGFAEKQEDRLPGKQSRNLSIDLHLEKIPNEFRKQATPLEAQLTYFAYCLENAIRSGTQTIVFIHGKGSGELRKRLLSAIRSDKRIREWKELREVMEASHGIEIRLS